MSEVKRFRADHRHVVETEFEDAQFVSASDYDALQQRLTVAERSLGDAYEWGYGDVQNSPNGYSDKEDRDKCIAELLKPSADPEHICECCGSKGWAANCDKCIPY